MLLQDSYHGLMLYRLKSKVLNSGSQIVLRQFLASSEFQDSKYSDYALHPGHRKVSYQDLPHRRAFLSSSIKEVTSEELYFSRIQYFCDNKNHCTVCQTPISDHSTSICICKFFAQIFEDVTSPDSEGLLQKAPHYIYCKDYPLNQDLQQNPLF